MEFGRAVRAALLFRTAPISMWDAIQKEDAMSITVSDPVGQGIGLVRDVIARVWPDPQQRAQAEIALEAAERAGQLEEFKARLSAIVAEASSTDPWTSRARPSFMYVFYAVILSVGVFAPAVGVFFPAHMKLFFENVAAGFAAIPKEMWTTFTIGYCGYSIARTWEKKKGVTK